MTQSTYFSISYYPTQSAFADRCIGWVHVASLEPLPYHTSVVLKLAEIAVQSGNPTQRDESGYQLYFSVMPEC